MTRGNAKRFFVTCALDSFKYEPDPDSVAHRLFLGCPQGCHYYSSAAGARVLGWLKNALALAKGPIVGTAKWFASLAPNAQMLIVAAILVAVAGLFAPRFLSAVAEFVQHLKQ